MQIDLKLVKKLAETTGVPGFEDSIRQLILEEIKPYVDEYRIDNLGNLIALKKGVLHDQPNAKKVLVDAHMDEIGFIVTHINEKGFLHFHTLGGFDPKTLTAQRVIVHGKKDLLGVMGSKAVHGMTPEERSKAPKIDDFIIDLGLEKEEVEKYVQIGDPVTRQQELVELGNCINSKSLDNRISVYILIEALKQIQNTPYDVYAVFSVQEEVGLRGAEVASQQINPDLAICLDVTLADDMPGVQAHKQISQLGKGTSIKIMDGSTICDQRMVDFMKGTADRNGIKWQTELLTLRASTNTSPLQRRGRQGSIAGAISTPTRYLHQVVETVHKEDIISSIELLTASLETIDKYHWER